MTAQDLFQEASELYAASKFDAAQCVLTRYFETGLSLEQQFEASFLQGKLFRAACDYDNARLMFTRAKALAETVSPSLVAKALNSIASIDSLTGNIPAAIMSLQQAADIYEHEQMPSELATALTNSGTLYRHVGDFSNAIDALAKAHDILSGEGSRKTAINLITLASTYSDLEQFIQAKQLSQDAFELASSLLDHETATYSLFVLGQVAFRQGLLDEALSAYTTSLKASRSYGFTRHEVEALGGMADVLSEQFQYEEALALLLKGLDVATGAGIAPNIFAMTGRIAALYNEIGNIDASLKYAKLCIGLAEMQGGDSEAQIAHSRLSEAYKAAGNYKKAYEHLEKARVFETTLLKARLDDKVAVQAVRLKMERLRSKAAIDREARTQAEHLAAVRTRELEEAHVEIVSRLALAAELRDDDTGEHTRRVGRSAAILAYAIGIPVSEIRALFVAARLHDVGKIGIPDSILLKPKTLTAAEFNSIKQHTTVGAKLLANGHSVVLRLAEQITLSHHERYDGRGYPHGLSGNAIPLTARIVAVADVLDALTHERPYKKAWSLHRALEEIYKASGTQFDPQVVDAARRAFGTGLFDPRDTGQKDDDWDCLLRRLKQTKLRSAPNVEIKKREAEASS